MAFHVYPDTYNNAQANPEEIPANTYSPLEDIEKLTGPDVIDGDLFNNVMFIRVALLDPGPVIAPTVKLRVTNNLTSPHSTGLATDIVATSRPGTFIYDGNGTSMASGIFFGHQGNGVYLVKVVVFEQLTSWEMSIKNNDPSSSREFTWVVADSDDHSQQPWIDIPEQLAYDTLAGQSIPKPLEVANKGTDSLTITDVPNTPLGSGFTLSEVPNPIDPNACGNLKITFDAPNVPGLTPAPGANPVTYTVTSDDTTALTAAGHNKQVSLVATTRQLEVMLVLDASGSMEHKPDGSPAGDPADSRWSKLQTAACEFLDLLGDISSDLGSFGVAVFPDVTQTPAPFSSAGDVLSSPGYKPINQPEVNDAKTRLLALKPQWSGTPMGDGIAQAMGYTAVSYGYFSDDSDPKQYNRRWMVLMSDGAHNGGPPDPPEFYGTGTGKSFKDKKVKVITIAYGESGMWEVDHALLDDIATDSEGQPLDAGADDAGLGLSDQFIKAITAGLDLHPSIDPGGRLTAGAPEVRRPVTIMPYDTKVAFVVNWGTLDAKRINVELVTPNCEVITAKTAQADPNISYHSAPRYQIYTVNHDYLRNASAPDKPRYGTWTLIISTRGLSGEDSELYTYHVISQSRLKLALATSQTSYYAGDSIDLSATLTLDGVGIPNAAVTLRLTAPGQSDNNWLAHNMVTPKEYEQAAETLENEDITALGIKAFALRNKGLVFNSFPQRNTIPMTDETGQGIYTTTVEDTSTPGTYELNVRAIGQTEGGTIFQREQRLQVCVGVRPEREFTLIDVEYHLITNRGPAVIGAEITVWPKDHFSNVVLVDPEFNPSIVLTAKGAEFTGPLVGNLDGSYSRSLQFNPGTSPSIGMEIAGWETIREFELAPVDRLHYVDQVIKFKEGSEAEEGANKHDDPQAVLGDVIKKDPERFVSLGGFGSITVGIQGKSILAIGNDDNDITVFMRRDQGLRPYLVEALPGGCKKDWVELGPSPGITQSFSLGKAGLRDAVAIRITDRSGITLDSDFSPIPSPGVSICGVGAKRVGQLLGNELVGCFGRILSIITLGLMRRKRKRS